MPAGQRDVQPSRGRAGCGGPSCSDTLLPALHALLPVLPLCCPTCKPAQPPPARAENFNWCTVPLSGSDVFLFVSLALVACGCLFGKLSAVWVLIMGRLARRRRQGGAVGVSLRPAAAAGSGEGRMGWMGWWRRWHLPLPPLSPTHVSNYPSLPTKNHSTGGLVGLVNNYANLREVSEGRAGQGRGREEAMSGG